MSLDKDILRLQTIQHPDRGHDSWTFVQLQKFSAMCYATHDKSHTYPIYWHKLHDCDVTYYYSCCRLQCNMFLMDNMPIIHILKDILRSTAQKRGFSFQSFIPVIHYIVLCIYILHKHIYMTSEIGVIDLMGKDKNLREKFGLAQPYSTYKAGFLSTLQGKNKFQIPQGHISFIFQVPCQVTRL